MGQSKDVCGPYFAHTWSSWCKYIDAVVNQAKDDSLYVQPHKQAMICTMNWSARQDHDDK